MGAEDIAMPASDKLAHLLELADQGPALRAALAEEVSELLTHWPPEYPEHMRKVCEALLAKAARDLDESTRARLRVQLYGKPEPTGRMPPRETTSQGLIEAARTGENLCGALAKSLGVDGKTAAGILADESGAKLAVACKGAQIERSAFSALALLTHPAHSRSQAFVMLDTFDTIPLGEAARLLHSWRRQPALA